MFRNSIIATIAIATIASTAPAQAAPDCLTHYNDFWEKISGDAKNISPETLVGANRAALRAFDACQSGDAITPRGFWDRLSGDVKDPEKFWEEMSLYGGAKK